MPAFTILEPTSLPITPPMDLNNASTRSGEAISAIPLILKSDKGVGLLGTDRSSSVPGSAPRLARTHLGVDLLVPTHPVTEANGQQEVYSTARGIVVQAHDKNAKKPDPADFLVTVHHAPFELGWVTTYRHLIPTPPVAKGQPVKSGELLGTTGVNDHLHFEVRQVFNEALLAQYLARYAGGLPTGETHYDLSGITPSYDGSANLGDTVNSLALDPTLVLYEWEEKAFRNDDPSWEDHTLDDVKLSGFDEVWRDRMRFVRVTAKKKAFFVPLHFGREEDLSLIETLRQAYLSDTKLRLVWRDSLFFSQIQKGKFARIIVDVAL